MPIIGTVILLTALLVYTLTADYFQEAMAEKEETIKGLQANIRERDDYIYDLEVNMTRYRAKLDSAIHIINDLWKIVEKKDKEIKWLKDQVLNLESQIEELTTENAAWKQKALNLEKQLQGLRLKNKKKPLKTNIIEMKVESSPIRFGEVFLICILFALLIARIWSKRRRNWYL